MTGKAVAQEWSLGYFQISVFPSSLVLPALGRQHCFNLSIFSFACIRLVCHNLLTVPAFFDTKNTGSFGVVSASLLSALCRTLVHWRQWEMCFLFSLICTSLLSPSFALRDQFIAAARDAVLGGIVEAATE